MQELSEMARNLGIEGLGALEKSRLVFEILRVTTERSGAVYGSGFLEILVFLVCWLTVKPLPQNKLPASILTAAVFALVIGTVFATGQLGKGADAASAEADTVKRGTTAAAAMVLSNYFS